jgi:hypothetical protein
MRLNITSGCLSLLMLGILEKMGEDITEHFLAVTSKPEIHVCSNAIKTLHLQCIE